MAAVTDRTWNLPAYPPIMKMTWSELLFAHWPVDPDILTRLLPRGLVLDTRQGQAWIGVVPFLMSDITYRYCPPIPRLNRFLELNIRTYVIYDDKPGVWFFSLDAASRIAVRMARATFNLPYMDARMSMTHNASGLIDYRSERVHRGEAAAIFDACYQSVGESYCAQPGTLEHWLTARYCLYSANRKGQLYRGEIDHEPWRISPAAWTERQNAMCEPLNVDLVGEPHLLYAEPITVRAWRASRCN